MSDIKKKDNISGNNEKNTTPSSLVQEILKNTSTNVENNVPVEDLSKSISSEAKDKGKVIVKGKEMNIKSSGNNSIDFAKAYIHSAPYSNTSNLSLQNFYKFTIGNKYKGKKEIYCTLEKAFRTLLNTTDADNLFLCENDSKAKSFISIIRDTKTLPNLHKITNLQKYRAIKLIADSHNLSW